MIREFNVCVRLFTESNPVEILFMSDVGVINSRGVAKWKAAKKETYAHVGIIFQRPRRCLIKQEPSL